MNKAEELNPKDHVITSHAKDSILFIDIETSAMPEDWSSFNNNNKKLPYIVQVAWLICSKYGESIHEHNFFIGENDYSIEPNAEAIHGLSKDWLLQNGKTRKEVMTELNKDLKKYTPLIVAHCVPLDKRMLDIAFHRVGIPNLSSKCKWFCTMEASKCYYPNIFWKPEIHLDELYGILFNKKPEKMHDALADVHVTAQSFFEMRRRRDIPEKSILNQKKYLKRIEKEKLVARISWMLIIIILGVIMLISS